MHVYAILRQKKKMYDTALWSWMITLFVQLERVTFSCWVRLMTQLTDFFIYGFRTIFNGMWITFLWAEVSPGWCMTRLYTPITRLFRPTNHSTRFLPSLLRVIFFVVWSSSAWNHITPVFVTYLSGHFTLSPVLPKIHHLICVRRGSWEIQSSCDVSQWEIRNETLGSSLGTCFRIRRTFVVCLDVCR